jgi:uncharacterized heparinase superfamily protein
MHLSVRCGSVGQNGYGGHAHNDQLSFELSLNGKPLIVDPGTYVYTPLPDERNKYRSTAMHNTLALDDREQNPWPLGVRGLFELRDRCHARVLALGKTHFVGEHCGFGTPHRRTLAIFRRQIHGLDECAERQRKKIHFHLAPEAQVEFLEADHKVRIKNGDASISLTCGKGLLTIRDSVYAPAYGVQCPSRVVVLESVDPEIRWTLEIE